MFSVPSCCLRLSQFSFCCRFIKLRINSVLYSRYARVCVWGGGGGGVGGGVQHNNHKSPKPEVSRPDFQCGGSPWPGLCHKTLTPLQERQGLGCVTKH